MPRRPLSPKRWPTTLAASLVLACSSGDAAGPSGAPPLPDNLAELDAEVAERIRAAHGETLGAPGDPGAWMALGMTYEAHDLFRLALASYTRALELEPTAKRWYRRALAHSKLGQGTEAIDAAQRALELEPGFAPLLARLGGFQFDEGLFEEAEASFRAAVELDPDQLRAWMGLARIQLQRDEFAEAVELLEAQRARRPRHGYVQKLLRTAYLGAGRVEEARELPAVTPNWQALGGNPWQDEFRTYLRRPLLERARSMVTGNGFEEGVRLLEEFLQDGSEDLNALSYLAVGYLKCGRLEDAERTLAEALERDPQSVVVLRTRAWLETSLGRNDAALATYELILGIDPTHLDTWKDLGRFHADRGRFPEAAEAYGRFLELDQRDPEVWAGLGLAEARRGRHTQAAEALGRAVAGGGTSDGVLLALATAQAELGQDGEARATLARLARPSEASRALLARLDAGGAGR